MERQLPDMWLSTLMIWSNLPDRLIILLSHVFPTPFWPPILMYRSIHLSPRTICDWNFLDRRRLHGGNHPYSQSCGGDAPSHPRNSGILCQFLNSKMSQFLHLCIRFNTFAIKLNKLANILHTVYILLVAFSNFSWSILLCLFFTYFPNSIFWSLVHSRKCTVKIVTVSLCKWQKVTWFQPEKCTGLCLDPLGALSRRLLLSMK